MISVDHIIADVFRSVISTEQGLNSSDIKIFQLAYDDKFFLTDGERLFKVQKYGEWLHTREMLKDGDIEGIRIGFLKKTFEYHKQGMSFYDAHLKAFKDYFLYFYKEIFAENIKIYVNDEAAKSIRKDGVMPCYKTLNGSRNKYLNYVPMSRKSLVNCAWDI